MAHSQAQVGDGTGAVLLHQDVLGLQVPVSDSRLSCANASAFNANSPPEHTPARLGSKDDHFGTSGSEDTDVLCPRSAVLCRVVTTIALCLHFKQRLNFFRRRCAIFCHR